MKYIVMILIMLGSLDSPAQVVVEGNMIDESIMSVRFRGFDNTADDEVYAGVPSINNPNHRVTLNHNWWEYNHMEVSYDSSLDSLDVVLWHCSHNDPNGGECGQGNNLRSPHQVSYPNWSENMQAIFGNEYSASNLMVLSVSVYNRDISSDVSLTNFQLNGISMDIPMVEPSPSINRWSIVGSCFNDFHLSGDIQLVGEFSDSEELSKIEINVGTRTLTTVEGNDSVIFMNGFEPCYGVM